MKLIKKYCVAVTAMLLASTATAGTLYWQVENDTEDYVTAQLFVEGGDLSSRQALSTELETPTGLQQTDLSSYTADGYLFYVELLNYDSGTTTTGYKWGYGDLVSSGYVSLSGLDVATVTVAATGHSIQNVPEPSSGLLLLMGGAMLALRRRRQK